MHTMSTCETNGLGIGNSKKCGVTRRNCALQEKEMNKRGRQLKLKERVGWRMRNAPPGRKHSARREGQRKRDWLKRVHGKLREKHDNGKRMKRKKSYAGSESAK
jgi:hypothetical protein